MLAHWPQVAWVGTANRRKRVASQACLWPVWQARGMGGSEQVNWRDFWKYGNIAAWILGGIVVGSSVAPVQDYTRRHGTPRAKLLLFMRSETGCTRSAKLLMRYAEEHHLDPLAFMAVIWRESNFNPNAHGKRPQGYMGAGDSDRGYGGLYWKTAALIARTEWHDKELARKIRQSPAILYQPDLNMDLTGANLRRLLDEHRFVYDFWDAYARHNSGDEGRGSLENVTAVKNRYYYYKRKLRDFDWRKAR